MSTISKIKRIRKKKNPQQLPLPIGGGHRDAAEMLSTQYALMLGRADADIAPEMLDMDELTTMLSDMDTTILAIFLQSEFGKGFLMGMLHQSYTYKNLAAEFEQDEEN